jgi:hypothetical protein
VERLGAPGTLAVVSHRSAAVVLELGDIYADVHEFCSPARRQTRRPDVRLHRGAVRAEDWALVDGLPVTTPLRTITDFGWRPPRPRPPHLRFEMRAVMELSVADALRVKVSAYCGTTVWERFDVDVSLERHFVADLEQVEPAPVVELDGIPPLPVFHCC